MDLDSLENAANRTNTCIEFVIPLLNAIEKRLDEVISMKPSAQKSKARKEIIKMIETVKSVDNLSSEEQKEVDEFKERCNGKIRKANIEAF